MISLFKNTTYFTILYFTIFLIDTIVKVNLEPFPLRYITKGCLVVTLILYFFFNEKEVSVKNRNLIFGALICFIIGDLFIIASANKLFLVFGVVLFAAAKVLYGIRFSNKKDFNIFKLIPFLLFCFTYMSVVMLLVYNKLGSYFIPVLLYLFIVMLTAQFAYLRKGEVNAISYWLVFVGVVLSMFSDSITILKEFYNPEFAYNQYTIMLFYGTSQYFIVLGLVKENAIKSIKSVTNI